MKATVIAPEGARTILPALADARNPDAWVYRYQDAATGWTLSVATHAAPNSGQLSLGGFRIAPVVRVTSPGFTTDHEALGLAVGMEEKVFWSRQLKVGGPLVARDTSRIVGGKCVLEPTPDARIGQARDTALLDFAIACFKDVESTGGFFLTTGQDLGHGTMHDGTTSSLAYLNARYKGSVVADTSVPTGEGNLQLLVGMLEACGVAIGDATVGLIGAGHIGMHLVHRLLAAGATLLVLESRAERRAELEALGVRTWAPGAKPDFLAQPMDAVAVNAAGGSLDAAAVTAIIANPRLRVVNGSENLVMPDPSQSERLRAARKLFAPTELGGMMGYLTAAEEYLSVLEGKTLEIGAMLQAAQKLRPAGHDIAQRVIADDYRTTFAEMAAR